MGEHIVMIHGMWCGAWVWEDYRRLFESRGYRCITPTLRHHSPLPGDAHLAELGTTSLLDYIQDLEDEIYALNEKPVIMGHSMGGLLAQILGSRGLAKALVLLTPASPRGVLGLRPSVIRSFLSITTRPGFWKRPMRQTFREAEYAMMQRLPAGQRREIYDKLVHESGRAGFEIGFWPLDFRKAAHVDSDALTCPTLIVSGKDDKLTPASVVRSIAGRYKASATLKEFSGHAHWVMGEPGWEHIAGYCSDWLDEVLARLPSLPAPRTAFKRKRVLPAGKILSTYWDAWRTPRGRDKRAHRRIGAAIEVEASVPFSGNAQYYPLGRTVNISRGGLLIDTDIPLHEGVHLNANLRTGGSARSLWIQGRVVRSSGREMALEITRGEVEKLSGTIPS